MPEVILINGPVFAAGAVLSDAVNLVQATIVRITVPSEFRRAVLSFMVSPDNILPYTVVCTRDGRERLIEVQSGSSVLGEINPGGWVKFKSSVPQNACTFRLAVQSDHMA